jgi:two-component system chemotaxis response regulator CheB
MQECTDLFQYTIAKQGHQSFLRKLMPFWLSGAGKQRVVVVYRQKRVVYRVGQATENFPKNLAMLNPTHYEAIVIGTSAGGLRALSFLFSGIPESYPLPIIVVQHRAKDENERLELLLQRKCGLKIKQAEEKELIRVGFIYTAPSNYHLLIERDRTFSLSSDSPVNYSRPSIDVLFETAAEAYQSGLIGIVLTGSNSDGACGIRAVHQFNGLAIAQDPEEAQFRTMPEASIDTGFVAKVLSLQGIQQLMTSIMQGANS